MARTDVETLVLRLEANMRGYDRAMRKASQDSAKTTQRIERHFETLENRLSTRFRRISRAGVAAFGALGATVAGAMAGRQLVRVADSWTELSNQILSAEASLGRGIASLEDLSKVATDTRSDLNATVRLYTRTERAVADLGLTTDQTLRFTELLNRAFVAGGQSVDEQRSAILQLSQALAAGQLMGEELFAIRTNAPLVARAIADTMGVGVGALRDLGSEGRITADVVVRAMLEAGEEIDAQFNATQMTVSQAMTNLQTAFSQAVGEADSAAGGTSALAEAIDQLATTITENKEGIADFVRLLGDMGSGAVEAASGVGALARFWRFQAGLTGPGADLTPAQRDLQAERRGTERELARRIGQRDVRGGEAFRSMSADDQERLTQEIARLENTLRDIDLRMVEGMAESQRQVIAEFLARGSATGSDGVAIPERPPEPWAGQDDVTPRYAPRARRDAEFDEYLDEMAEALEQASHDAAVAQADAYKEQISERRSEFSQEFGRTFADGMRAAFDGDLQEFITRRLQNAFYNAISNAMQQVGESLFDMVVGSGKGGGAGGILEAIFGGGSSKPTGRAIGGPVRKNQPYLVGEHGRPELFVPDQNGTVVPQISGSGNSASFTFSPKYSIDARGATPDAVAMLNRKIDMVRQEDQRTFAGRLRATLPGVMDEARRDGVI